MENLSHLMGSSPGAGDVLLSGAQDIWDDSIRTISISCNQGFSAVSVLVILKNKDFFFLTKDHKWYREV